MLSLKLKIGLGVAGALLAAMGAYVWLTPRKLGLETPRMVLVTGDARVDGAHSHAAQALSVGAHVLTGPGSSGCFSVHASRVCLGTDSGVRLSAFDASSATVGIDRGTVIVSTAGDALRLEVRGGSIQVSHGTTAVEASDPDVTVRVLDGVASVTGGSRPAADIPSPSAVGLVDGRPRPPVPALEAEEKQVIELALGWQGSAGAIVEVSASHGRIQVDDHTVGRAPASFLLREGTHTVVVDRGPHDTFRKTLELSGGQKVTLDG